MTSPGAAGAWVRHQFALASLAEVLSILERAAIPVLAVKGIVLAYTLYEDVAERPLCDVDLRVRPRDFVRAFQALRARGFAPIWISRQLGAISFDVRGTIVDLEATVGPPGLCALSVTEMLARSHKRSLAGPLQVLEPEIHDHAVLLIINAYKDKMECATWSLRDLDTILSRVDGATLLARIDHARIRAIAWIVGDWMARERGSERWRNLRDRIGANPPRPVYAWAMGRWMKNSSSFMVRALARAGSDSTTQRVWALAATGAGTAISLLGRAL